MHMNIFKDDAFSAVTMTAALEDIEFRPGYLGKLALFEDVPVSTNSVSIERRANELSLIRTSLRGAPIEEARKDKSRNIRKFDTVRVAKGITLSASEIQNLRAFGEETELETMTEYLGREMNKLVADIEATWENMMLGAVQGVVYDADGSELWDFFADWGVPAPAELEFELDDASINVELKCRNVVRAMMRASSGAWTGGTFAVGLCGDSFFDKLTTHKSIRETYLGTTNAVLLNRAFGPAQQQVFRDGGFAVFECGGIVFVNYRGVDNYNPAAPKGTVAAMGIEPDKCKFLPVGAPGVFQRVLAPYESIDLANSPGRPLYAGLIRDEKRNFWVRPEVYSYPLFLCTRPEMLLSATAF